MKIIISESSIEEYLNDIAKNLELEFGKLLPMGVSGKNGLYRDSNGDMVKICSISEAQKYQILLGKTTNHFPKVYEVKISKSYGMVHKEYIRPTDATDIENIFGLLDAKWPDISYQDSIGASLKNKNFVQSLPKEYINTYKDLVSIVIEAKNLKMGMIDIGLTNIGEKNNKLVIFDPFI